MASVGVKAILYDVRWQRHRVGMLGKWSTPSQVRENIDWMDDYLNEVRHCSLKYSPGGVSEYMRRCYRIVNYMNAIRMGYNAQKNMVGSECDQLVISFRDRVQAEWQSLQHLGVKYGGWSWIVVEEHLVDLARNYPDTFKKLEQDLKKRKGNAIRRHDTAEHRPELLVFLELIGKVKERIEIIRR